MGIIHNACKTQFWLVTKEGYLQLAKEVFEGTLVQITDQGWAHLLGRICLSINLLEKRWINGWTSLITKLPHAAYISLTHGLYGKVDLFSSDNSYFTYTASCVCLVWSVTHIVPAITGIHPM